MDYLPLEPLPTRTRLIPISSGSTETLSIKSSIFFTNTYIATTVVMTKKPSYSLF